VRHDAFFPAHHKNHNPKFPECGGVICNRKGNRFSGSMPAMFMGMLALGTCELSGHLSPGGTSNKFTCPLPKGIPQACGTIHCADEDTQPMVFILAGIAALVSAMSCVYCLVRLRQHQIRRKTKLLNEVTSTSATVMNDLTDRKQSAGPVVIVDGKSMNGNSQAPDAA